ncbi:hypothetical protein PVAP13_8NG245000 [Panicum virgatum]|uniref:DUF4220 domain-containing protein n=1 Tax=Panicum virgatum TaxID=38727 RepID=A0A8T0PHL7_PANVG|nr:hypothetical protein PVAP13_8NG245000 [Panicum virgatum]
MNSEFTAAWRGEGGRGYHANTTSFSKCAKDLWRSPRGIEVLVVLTAVNLLFMATFGYWRRRTRNSFIQYGVLGAYTLSSSLVSYTLGAMHSSAVKSSMYPIWAVSLYVLFGCADSTTAYNLNDNNQHASLVFLYLVYHIYISLIAAPDYLYLTQLASFKFVQIYWAHYLAISYDPATMKGYHYLVDWPHGESKLDNGALYATELRAGGDQVIDIERIWQCRELRPEVKDLCLSFSLFHLLRRRCFEFACAESSLQKTHDFVFKGLLSENDNGDTDYNRVFKVVEVELAFIYDFFFTKYAVLYYGSKKVSTIWSLATASLISRTAYRLIASFVYDHGSDFEYTTISDVAITVLILACIALLLFLQELFYWSTIWGRVSIVCHYVREQASLLESVRYKHKRPKVGLHKFMRRYCSLIILPDFNHLCAANKERIYAQSIRKGYGKPAAVKLPAEGFLVGGESSLVHNAVDDLLWACRTGIQSGSGITCIREKENQTHIIMTWHIATCYCEMATLKYLCPRNGGELKFHLDVATILSKYCAYLVVSAPKLLPGNHYDTSLIFDAIAVEAAQSLRKAKDKYEAMRSLTESTEMTIFQMGVTLGRQLEETEDGKRWKVLADFWAELLLYVAPSDNVKEHIKCLGNGGEFLTHLWALLSHAGILDRGKRNVNDIENSASDQPCPGEISYSAALRLWHATSYLDRCRERADPAHLHLKSTSNI